MIEWFDDLAIGMKFKSPTVQITERDIKRFAAEYDPQPMHLDETAAAETMCAGVPEETLVDHCISCFASAAFIIFSTLNFFPSNLLYPIKNSSS